MEDLVINKVKGSYDTDFSNLNDGCIFPSAEVRARNKVYAFNKKLFTGEYAQNKKLVALVNEEYTQINYKVLPLNYFELIVNKLDSLLFGNEITVTTGDVERDRIVHRLIDKTGWMKSVRQAVKFTEIYGDCPIKTGRNGVSVFSPKYAYKVVDISDKHNIKGYVLHELLYDKIVNGTVINYKPTHIRILISCKGFDYERIYEYKGNNNYGTLGRPVRYKYKDRWIPKKGRYYWTDISDCETVQWLSVNTEKDGVYGSSSFDSVKELIWAIETRLSTENWVIDAHGKPLLLVGLSSLKTDEKTGEYYLSVINGKYMVDKGGSDGHRPEYLTWDGKLEASKQVRDDLMDTFYELSEMGKTFLSGEYSGNISEESLNNIIKSAIDRGNREVNDLWYSIRNSLYVLCRLNDISVNLEEINITFNVGRADDVKVVADICEKLSNIGLFSKQTLLSKYFGYSEDDAIAEFDRIKAEQGGSSDDTDGFVETDIRE